MLLTGLFYHSYMFYLFFLERMDGVMGYCYMIYDDVVVVQSFLSRLAEWFV